LDKSLKCQEYDPNNHKPFAGLKLAAVSLGCSKNRVDTEEILGCLTGLGMFLTNDFQEADLIMVNTCGFIESAQEESIKTLCEIAANDQARKPILFAAGCLVETMGTEMINIMPEIDGAIGVHSYQHLEQFVNMLLQDQRVAIKRNASDRTGKLANRILSTSPHSVNIKIAEGCNNRCGYCLIPKIRGQYRSRDPEDIVNEISYFLDQGAREISLIAQDTTAYGIDRSDFPDLAGLIRLILSIDKFFWLRIMYTYPSRITDDLIRLIAEEPRICKYLDIPIQHASSYVLSNMCRHYNKNELDNLIIRLKREIPGIILRTTCMIGYPGEGTRDFLDLLAFLEYHKFDHLGAFLYSRQANTPAGQPSP
jgi:ribosomal protein S12 methylthiotransferase